MSLIHRHPGSLDPRVHYRSPFFSDDAARIAEERREAAQRKGVRDATIALLRSRLGLTRQQASILMAIRDAGEAGITSVALQDSADFINWYAVFCRARAALARRAIEISQHKITRPGGGFQICYVLTPEARETIRVVLARDSADPSPVAPLPDLSPEVKLMRAFGLLKKHVPVLLALHRAGVAGLTSAEVGTKTGVDKPGAVIGRMNLRLVKAGFSVEAASGHNRYRLPADLRREIEKILSGGDA